MIDAGVVGGAVIGLFDVARCSSDRVTVGDPVFGAGNNFQYFRRNRIQLVGGMIDAAYVAEISGVLLFKQCGREDQTGGHALHDSQGLDSRRRKTSCLS